MSRRLEGKGVKIQVLRVADQPAARDAEGQGMRTAGVVVRLQLVMPVRNTQRYGADNVIARLFVAVDVQPVAARHQIEIGEYRPARIRVPEALRCPFVAGIQKDHIIVIAAGNFHRPELGLALDGQNEEVVLVALAQRAMRHIAGPKRFGFLETVVGFMLVARHRPVQRGQDQGRAFDTIPGGSRRRGRGAAMAVDGRIGGGGRADLAFFRRFGRLEYGEVGCPAAARLAPLAGDFDAAEIEAPFALEPAISQRIRHGAGRQGEGQFETHRRARRRNGGGRRTPGQIAGYSLFICDLAAPGDDQELLAKRQVHALRPSLRGCRQVGDQPVALPAQPEQGQVQRLAVGMGRGRGRQRRGRLRRRLEDTNLFAPP